MQSWIDGLDDVKETNQFHQFMPLFDSLEENDL